MPSPQVDHERPTAQRVDSPRRETNLDEIDDGAAISTFFSHPDKSSLPVVEVAVACGFVSASHFSKCYRELYARSPQQERADRKQLLVA